MHVSNRIGAVLLVGALAACGGNAKKPVEGGGLAVNVAALTGGPQVVYVRIYGPTTPQPGVPPAIDQTIAAESVSGSGFRATFSQIPAGTYALHATGHDAFDALPGDPPQWESGTPDPEVTVVGGQQTNASLFMQELNVVTVDNNAPWVSMLSANVSTVYSSTNGGTATSATLSAALVDADGDLTDYAWSDDVGGSFSIASDAFVPAVADANITTTWTPPSNFSGIAHLYLEVFDAIHNASRVVMSMTVVATPGYGSAVVDVAFNNNPMMAAPLVANYITDPDTLAILGGGGQILPGADTLLTVAAWDPNGDSVGFLFTDDCGGSFATPTITGTGTAMDPYSAEVIYTAPATAPSSGTCTAAAAMTDGNGGELFVNLGIHIGPPGP